MGLPAGQIPAWFSAMDTDGNGMVNLIELSTSETKFAELCNQTESLLENEFFVLADNNTDGNVTLAEQRLAINKL
jgi:Ca2+-binding EF-hand superfamily protein